MNYDLGIDVGTSYTAAAVRRVSGAVEVIGLGPIADNIPTVLYLASDGSMLAGDAANRRAVIDPVGAAREFKRRMGDPTPLILRSSPFSAEALMARMIDHVVERVADRERGLPRHTVVTHPANWGPYKLDLLDQALRSCGLEAVTRLSEPHAAALAYAAESRISTGTTVAMYDLGGGTFDAAVLAKSETGFELLGEAVGIEHLGGVDFDDAVFHFVRAEVGDRWPSDPDDPSLPAPMLHLRRACMEAKELLSSETEVSIPVLLPGVDRTVLLQRRQFEEMIAPRVGDTVAALETALLAAGVGPAQLKAILLVGGSSRIPLVGQMLRERFGSLVATDVDPLYAVARGAAVAAGVRGEATSGVASQPPPPAARQSPAETPPPLPLGAYPPPPPPMQVAIPASPPAPQPVPVPVSASMPAPVPVIAPVFVATNGPALPPSGPDSYPAAPFQQAEPARPGRAKRLIPLVVLVGVIASAAAYFVTRPSDKGTAKSSDAKVDIPVTTVVAAATVASGSGMVSIPAGTYPLGIDKPEANAAETLSRTVDLGAYNLDLYEVTNDNFKAFVDTTEASPPLSWPGGRYPADKGKHPVRGVNFEWASAYCASLGKRLPSEAEWEVAARGGSEARLYPWAGDASAVPLPLDTYPVGSIEANKSAFGVYDLAGNAWEWVEDSYDPRVKASLKVLRGGQNGWLRRNVTRLPVDPRGSNALTVAGFRCAAGQVDVSAKPLVFVSVTKPPPPTPPVVKALAPGVLVDDDFSDATSGWTEKSNDKSRYGYHPNEYYHLETKGPNQEVLVSGPVVPEPGKLIKIRTETFVEPNNTSAGGTFDYGIAFRFDSQGQGLVFVVGPRDSAWRICNRLADGTYKVIQEAKRTIPEKAQLEVRMTGPESYEFSINGQVVHQRTIPGYQGTGTGFVLLSYANSEKAHIHYETFSIAGA